MKNGIVISLLTAIISFFYISENSTLKIVAIILTVSALAFLFLKDVVIYNIYKSKIGNFKENISGPIINVNKVSWKILELIPKIDKMTAKHIVYNRRHLGKYKNIDDFFRINQMSEEIKESIVKYIIIE